MNEVLGPVPCKVGVAVRTCKASALEETRGAEVQGHLLFYLMIYEILEEGREGGGWLVLL